MVVDEIHVKGIGRAHTTPDACHQNQTTYLTGLLELRKIQCERPIEGDFCQA